MHDAPDPEEIARVGKWFAMECNNRAWALAALQLRTAADDDEMLTAAHASAFHWREVGNETNRALAAMLLAEVHALIGDASRARRYAQECFDFVTSRESPAWQVAFAHAILAHAAAVANDGALHATHYEAASRVASSLAEGDRAVFDQTWRMVPPPLSRACPPALPTAPAGE
ncbi:MAG TPA: hypothetical protein VFP44_08295 [Usitatibacter sp.]|nr:hypothetical protein [Usitatibacter sp.]